MVVATLVETLVVGAVLFVVPMVVVFFLVVTFLELLVTVVVFFFVVTLLEPPVVTDSFVFVVEFADAMTEEEVTLEVDVDSREVVVSSVVCEGIPVSVETVVLLSVVDEG